jgi:hypothetical protein
MAATHHFHEHNRPLPVMQILNDGSLFSFGMSGYWYTTYEAHQFHISMFNFVDRIEYKNCLR